MPTNSAPEEATLLLTDRQAADIVRKFADESPAEYETIKSIIGESNVVMIRDYSPTLYGLNYEVDEWAKENMNDRIEVVPLRKYDHKTFDPNVQFLLKFQSKRDAAIFRLWWC